MLYRIIFVCLFSLVLVKYTSGQSEPMEISFVIRETRNHFTCDHGLMELKKYTVLEEESLSINIRSNSDIQKIHCTLFNNFNNKTVLFYRGHDQRRKEVTLKVYHVMGAVWDCKIIHDYTRLLHCYMQLHVKRTKAPQTILVNNVISQPVRTDLSEQHVDFRLEYEYADNDVVEVSCIKNNPDLSDYCHLGLEYHSTGMLNDSNIKHLHSEEAVGIRVRLHSDHHNSVITCNCSGFGDFTNVQVTFIKQTRFSTDNSHLMAVWITAVIVVIFVIVDVVVVVYLRRRNRRPATPLPVVVPTTNYYENMLSSVRELAENDYDREHNYEVVR